MGNHYGDALHGSASSVGVKHHGRQEYGRDDY